MEKLSLDALKERAEVANSDELLESITGGRQDPFLGRCHEGSCGYANEWADNVLSWLWNLCN